ncbi:hypothetical protein [Listeria booriae]|uniref:hypothetical protein n=1 Tax=Listeria booriae TaxID=1552123 RepID=UPI00162A3574|nr:hypothetical protein [Listeria booriae]MBC2149655.1 hypothetical protein [Listeria booriae]
MKDYLTDELIRQVYKKIIEFVFNKLSPLFQKPRKKMREEKQSKLRTTEMEFFYSKKTENGAISIWLSKVTQNRRESAATNSLPNKKM